MKTAYEQIQQDYKDKFEKYTDIAAYAHMIKDVEMEKLAIQRLSGTKMMIEYLERHKGKYIKSDN